MNKQKGFSPLILIIFVGLVLIGTLVLVFSKKQSPVSQANITTNTENLDSESSELDNSDLDQMDSQLDQLNMD